MWGIMEWKRHKELSREIDRYLASRKRKKINFRKLFHLPLELKPALFRPVEESAKKEESYYEAHAQKVSKLKSFIGGLRKMFKTTKEGYLNYQELAQQPKEEKKGEGFRLPEKSWLRAFIDIFRPSKKPEYAAYPVAEEVNIEFEVSKKKEGVDEVKEDLKQISKIALHVLKTMPKREIENFKKTENFENFKTILKKYELIK